MTQAPRQHRLHFDSPAVIRGVPATRRLSALSRQKPQRESARICTLTPVPPVPSSHAVIGGLSGVHQFCRIGRHAITGGCTKLVQDVPPFMIADGNPAEIRGINQVGMERRGFDAEIIRTLREAYKLIYRSNLNTKQAVAAIREQIAPNPRIEALIAFIETSKRGIVH